MTYNLEEINLNRILNLRKKYKLPVGYSNHNNDKGTLNVLTAYRPSAIFLYCKPKRKRKRVYPDDKHAFFLDEF